MSNLPPYHWSKKTKLPMGWVEGSQVHKDFYRLKAFLKKQYPDRVWTNDAVFEFVVGKAVDEFLKEEVSNAIDGDF